MDIFKDDGCCVVRLSGRFDAGCKEEFLRAVATAVADTEPEIKIDLGSVDYVDSSALGMLLIARDNAKGAGKTVSIAHACGSVRQILDIANFGKIFPMT